jgi:predicted nuclease of predicted toxin-antitoxin system
VKFKTDENLPSEAASVLRDAGFEADSVREEALEGSEDTALALRIRAEGRILITLDLDFSNIRAYPPQDYPGLIVLRLKCQDRETVVTVVRRLVLALNRRSPAGELWIVEEDHIRRRAGK